LTSISASFKSRVITSGSEGTTCLVQFTTETNLSRISLKESDADDALRELRPALVDSTG
jgi:hypothetical protein